MAASVAVLPARPGLSGLAQAYRPDIDGLRAVAVLSVFAFHLFPDSCPGGFIGVDVFFVISGYLISRIIMSEVDARRFSFAGFYERRVRRIAPALAGLLLGTSLGAAVLLPPTEYISFVDSARAAALSLSNFFFWRHTGYFGLGSNALPLLHTWSLAVEEQFYLVFPAIFLVGRRLRLSWAAVIVPLFALSLGVALVQTPADPTGAFYSPITRAWEFLTGSLFAAGVVPAPTRRIAEILAAIGAALLLASLVLIDDGSPFPGWRALLPCAGSAALIWAGQSAVLAAPLRSVPAVFVGRISYSLYLWHWPVIVAARIFWGGAFTLAEALAVSLVAVALAWASWRFIEEPPRRNRRLFTRVRLFAGFGVLIGVALLQTWVINSRHGLPGRYNPAAARFLSDAPWTPPRGCGATGDACEVGAAGSASFAVIGDSMGLALAPGIDLAAREHDAGGLYYAQGGCIPLLGLGSPECQAFVKMATGRVVADRSVRTVLLICRWTTAVEPRRFGRQNSRTAQITEPQLVAAFARTRQALGSRHLLVLTDIPEQPVDVRSSDADRANLRLPPFAGVGRQAFDRRVARTDALLAHLVPGRDNLDASKLLCDAAICAATLGGSSLYADDNHPSVLGAEFLDRRGLFDPLFRR